MARRKATPDDFERVNRQCAAIIAGDPVKYQPGSPMQEWADMILTMEAAQPDDAEAGPLFAAVGKRRAA